MRRILIIADSVSSRYGGEAASPLHYYRVLRNRGDSVWLLCHDRVRHELAELYPSDIDRRIFFVADRALHRFLTRFGANLPDRVSYVTTGQLSRWYTQWAQRRLARRLIQAQRIDIVHQPTPVSPKEPSWLFNLGAPVVIGPLNGGMSYPPAFRRMEGAASRVAMILARVASNLANRVVPGKRRAALVLVANERSARVLPSLGHARIQTVVENGVDLHLWQHTANKQAAGSAGDVTSFMFLGRLVPLKAVDILIEAFAAAVGRASISLTIVGDGPEQAALKALADSQGLASAQPHAQGKIFFAGWQPQQRAAALLAEHDALMMPSLHDCGGAVVLEAMALGLPVAATNWGGPPDYIDEQTGLLLEPTSRQALIQQFADAMTNLARDSSLCERLGRAGRDKVVREFDWERKVDHVLTLFEEVVVAQEGGGPANGRLAND
jgi:glycosyltransferase involved in cell wall biosynthesis